MIKKIRTLRANNKKNLFKANQQKDRMVIKYKDIKFILKRRINREGLQQKIINKLSKSNVYKWKQ